MITCGNFECDIGGDQVSHRGIGISIADFPVNGFGNCLVIGNHIRDTRTGGAVTMIHGVAAYQSGAITPSNNYVFNNFVSNNMLVKPVRLDGTGNRIGNNNIGINDVRLAINSNLVMTNTDLVVIVNATGARTITLPDATNCAGQTYMIKRVNTSANNVTVQGTGGQTIDDAATYVLANPYASATVMSDGTNWLVN